MIPVIKNTGFGSTATDQYGAWKKTLLAVFAALNVNVRSLVDPNIYDQTMRGIDENQEDWNRYGINPDEVVRAVQGAYANADDFKNYLLELPPYNTQTNFVPATITKIVNGISFSKLPDGRWFNITAGTFTDAELAAWAATQPKKTGAIVGLVAFGALIAWLWPSGKPKKATGIGCNCLGEVEEDLSPEPVVLGIGSTKPQHTKKHISLKI